MYIISLNKIIGYPDKELKNIYFIIVIIIIDVLSLVFFIKKVINKKIFFVILIIIHTPVISIPANIFRQIYFSKHIDMEKFYQKNHRKTVSFITKIDMNNKKIYALGKINNDQDVVFVFNQQNDLYEFQSEYWLLDGHGSMDAQIPNYPMSLQLLFALLFESSHQ
jgi:hypothetical protein